MPVIVTMIERIPLGHPMTAAEFDTNMQAAEAGFLLCASAAELTAGLALKLNANHTSVTNQRVPVDGSYGFFTMASGVASLVEATATEVFNGTAGKPIGASRLKSLFAMTDVASSSGVLTLNWLPANIPTLAARVSVVANITSVVISNLPDFPVSVLFENTGAFTVTLPAHNATVDGRTLKRIDGDVWPSLPTGNGSGFLLNLRKTPTGGAGSRIFAQLGGIFAA